jgi:hypothetical protein
MPAWKPRKALARISDVNSLACVYNIAALELRIGAREVNVADQRSNKYGPLVHLQDIKKLQGEIKSEFYELRNGKIWFSEEIKREHRRLKAALIPYLLQCRFFAILTTPFIYVLIIPFSLLDLFVSTFQAVCFPAYEIPKARHQDFIAIDRAG